MERVERIADLISGDGWAVTRFFGKTLEEAIKYAEESGLQPVNYYQQKFQSRNVSTRERDVAIMVSHLVRKEQNEPEV